MDSSKTPIETIYSLCFLHIPYKVGASDSDPSYFIRQVQNPLDTHLKMKSQSRKFINNASDAMTAELGSHFRQNCTFFWSI